MKRLRVFAILAAALMFSGCKSELYANLSERDANEMVVVLREKGIPAERESGKEGYSVKVERDAIAPASAALASRGLPRKKFDSFGTVFQGGQMVASPFEERARFIYALEAELSHSITQISGVTDARVHVALPENSPLSPGRRRPRASVFIYHLPGADMSGNVSVIKTQIVNAIEGLSYEDVSLALFPNAALTDSSQVGTGKSIASFLQGVLSLGVFLLLTFGLYSFLKSSLRTTSS